MSEQNNGIGMDFANGTNLEDLFGAAIPQVNLGESAPVTDQTPATQAAPQQMMQPTAVTEPPQLTAQQPVQQSAPVLQAVPQQVMPQQPAPIPQQQSAPVPQQPTEVPSAQPAAGQVVDLFGAVAGDAVEDRLARMANAVPVFECGTIKDEITDTTLTFEQLRVKMSADCPELEARSHVSWTVSYGGTSEKIANADTSIFETKAKIEKSKKFKDALKKLKDKDKDPVCMVKPTVTAQKKGTLPFPSYKGLYDNTEQAERSGKAIAYIPAQDGKVYEMRRNEIGTFIAPSKRIAELEDIRAGFQMSLPRFPADKLAQIIAFFRKVCAVHGGAIEALVNVLWDKECCEYILHVPPQRVNCVSVVTDLSEQPDSERYLHVMDVHSHNTMSARFSKTDDEDEQATRLYMVIGRLDQYYPEIRCRFACGGSHVDIPVEQVCERADAPFVRNWLNAIQTDTWKEAA